MDLPICDAANNHTCVMCLHDADCLGNVTLFEACHTEWQEQNNQKVQVIGRCVVDSYNKGFQVYAVVVGTLAMFFVIFALLFALIAIVKPGGTV